MLICESLLIQLLGELNAASFQTDSENSKWLCMHLPWFVLKCIICNCKKEHRSTMQPCLIHPLCIILVWVTDWERTSLEKSIRFFRTSFLQPLLKACKVRVAVHSYASMWIIETLQKIFGGNILGKYNITSPQKLKLCSKPFDLELEHILTKKLTLCYIGIQEIYKATSLNFIWPRNFAGGTGKRIQCKAPAVQEFLELVKSTCAGTTPR